MLHLSHGSKRPSWFAATRTRWRKSTRNPRSLDFRTSRPRRAPTRPSTDTPRIRASRTCEILRVGAEERVRDRLRIEHGM